MNFICLQEENEGRKGRESMAVKKQKLELTWIGKDEQPRLEPRIEILHRLLRPDGTLWITIDDDESHYLKVLCDEVFGRNFVNNVIWEKKYSPQNDAKWLSDTKFVTVELLDKIHDEMQPDESLLICCKSFSKACKDRYPNITVKKIPNMLLRRCEFGKEDYSLNIISMPIEQNVEEPEPHPETKTALNKPKRSARKWPLFGEDDES